MARKELPIPPHFKEDDVGSIYRVPYQQRAKEATEWAEKFQIRPAAMDQFRICLVAVDVQNTFCIPDFELFVGGRSGTGAVDDNRRLCKFIYRNLDAITEIAPTMDTHQAIQIFHALFLVNDEGKHPDAFTLISYEDITEGHWKFNPKIAGTLGINPHEGQKHLLHYAKTLKEGGKFDHTIWPYHAMLGGIGHALVPAVEEAFFFHSVARYARLNFQIKGDHPLTEHYSVLGPEVMEDGAGNLIAEKNNTFIGHLLNFDAVVIAGQAKSHCVAWTIDHLLEELGDRDMPLARKVYLLEDCTSPVVVPGVLDYTDQADKAFQRFSDVGMHLVRSTEPMERWAGIGKGL
jgi:nicotinamidase-related amidase